MNFATAIKEELDGIRKQQKGHGAHLEALQNGETFTPAVTQPTSGKKRKNNWVDKGGSPKRRRCVSDDEDDLDDEGDDDSDSDEESGGSDSESDSEDVESDKLGLDGETGDEDEEMEEVTEEVLKEKIKECKEAIKAGRERSNEARLRKKEAGDALSSLEKTLVKVQKEKNAFCSMKRSEVCKTNCCLFCRLTLTVSFRAMY